MKKRNPIVTLDLPRYYAKKPPPPGKIKKWVPAYYIKAVVFAADGIIEVFRGNICILIFDTVQNGVTYYDKNFKPEIIRYAFKKAKTLTLAKSGEYSFSASVTYITDAIECASKNPEYKKEFDKIDQQCVKFLTAQKVIADMQTNNEFYKKAGIKMTRSNSLSNYTLYKRNHLENKKNGTARKWSEESKKKAKETRAKNLQKLLTQNK